LANLLSRVGAADPRGPYIFWVTRTTAGSSYSLKSRQTRSTAAFVSHSSVKSRREEDHSGATLLQERVTPKWIMSKGAPNEFSAKQNSKARSRGSVGSGNLDRILSAKQRNFSSSSGAWPSHAVARLSSLVSAICSHRKKNEADFGRIDGGANPRHRNGI
jgi:hypothetical protein